jgi:hypothetical protein
MSNLLGDVFSFGNTAKRKIKGLLDDPLGSLQQFVGNENDRAGRFNQLTDNAATEMQNRIKSGGKMGPNQVKLAGLLADAYNPAGMVVWHGSPHKFSKFDSSKIGTGEGAQAYGHGIYTAESKDVAQEYARKLGGVDIKLGGKSLDEIIAKGTGSEAWAANRLKNDFLVDSVSSASDVTSPKFIAQTYDYYINGGGDTRVADLLKKHGKVTADMPGSVYRVDLPDDQIAKMLDWDKPLSQQAPEVQKALQAKQVQDSIAQLKASGQLGDYSQAELQQLRGEDWYDMLRQAAGDSNAAPSDFLRQQGIPGIRYLDGGSRGTGQGTSNFVVFPGNENLLTILERNGQPMGLLGQ